MRKSLFLVLVLLCLLLCLPAYAGILQTQANLESATLPTPFSMAATDEAVYIATEGGVYRWDGENIPIPVRIHMPEDMNFVYWLIGQGSSLYALDQRGGMLREVAVDGQDLTIGSGVKLDWRDLKEYPAFVQSAFIHEGRLFIETGDNAEGCIVYAFELDGGKRETLITAQIGGGFKAYDENRLVFVQYDSNRAYAPQGEHDLPQIMLYNVKTGAIEKLAHVQKTSIGGLAYDKKNGLVYYAASDGLYCVDNQGKQTHMANLGASNVWKSGFALMFNHLYILEADAAYYFYDVGSETLQAETLRVLGMNVHDNAAAFSAFAKAFPGTGIVSDGSVSFYEASQIFTDFLSESAGDIYHLDRMDVLKSVIDKYYARPLSESVKIAEILEGMHPALTASFYKDGELFAVPYRASIGVGTGYSRAAMDTLSITENDLPKTIGELIDFAANWQDNYGGWLAPVALVEKSEGAARQWLFHLVFRQQVAYCAKEGIPFTMDTITVRELLTKLDNADADLKHFDATNTDGDALFTLWYDMFSGDSHTNEEFVFWPIGLDENTPMLHTLHLSALFISAKTNKVTEALFLAENLVAPMDVQTRVILNKEAQGVENGHYLKQREEYMQQLENLKNAEGSETEKANLKKRIEDALLETEKVRYFISPEQVAFYQSEIENVVPETGEYSMFVSQENLLTLYRRYADGQMQAEAFIQETEKLLQRMRSENQ